MDRLHQSLLIATVLPLCWLAMQATHEAGHVVAAWATGGTVSKVVLHPLAISRTDVRPNPSPGVVVWAGPLFGVLAPIGLHALVTFLRSTMSYITRFFAGFCLVANGAYIGVGALDRVGDAGQMLRSGTPIWGLFLFGAVSAPVGLFFWHGLGRHFGLGKSAQRVPPTHAYTVAGLLIVIVFATSL